MKIKEVGPTEGSLQGPGGTLLEDGMLCRQVVQALRMSSFKFLFCKRSPRGLPRTSLGPPSRPGSLASQPWPLLATPLLPHDLGCPLLLAGSRGAQDGWSCVLWLLGSGPGGICPAQGCQ